MNTWWVPLFAIAFFLNGCFNAAAACEYAHKKYNFRFGVAVMCTAWSVIMMYVLIFT